MGRAPLIVAEVDGRKELTRFAELPVALHGADPRFVAPVGAWERFRLDARRNPYFEQADACYFRARRAARPVGRIAAHLPQPGGEGRFGFWSVADDEEAADGLLAAARSWLSEQGCRSMRGPLSFEPDDEPGVLVAGHDAAGRTALPWHPRWEAELLEAKGGQRDEQRSMWRLPTSEVGAAAPSVEGRPAHGGAYVDPRLVLEGIAAVPDVADAVRSAGLRGAWSLARRARAADWDDAVVVACDGDPAARVPLLQVAAGRAGYRTVTAPWSPDPSVAPEVVYARFRFDW
jgi:hypothetical protein